MNFQRVKEIRIVEILAKRGISLRYNGEWGSAVCPLPSHKPGDRDRTFQVNTRSNFFKCWSASCNEKAGKKGGDCINLVALLDGLSEFAAAKKLSEAFNIVDEKNPHHSDAGSKETRRSKGTVSNHDSPTIVVKGYLHETGLWLDGQLMCVPEPFRKPLKKALMDRLKQSYENGKRLTA